MPIRTGKSTVANDQPLSLNFHSGLPHFCFLTSRGEAGGWGHGIVDTQRFGTMVLCRAGVRTQPGQAASVQQADVPWLASALAPCTSGPHQHGGLLIDMSCACHPHSSLPGSTSLGQGLDFHKVEEHPGGNTSRGSSSPHCGWKVKERKEPVFQYPLPKPAPSCLTSIH